MFFFLDEGRGGNTLQAMNYLRNNECISPILLEIPVYVLHHCSNSISTSKNKNEIW